MISTLTNCFFSDQTQHVFHLAKMDDISFNFFKILSKISNISIPSRKQVHIMGKPENHRLKSAGWQGICDHSMEGKNSQTLPSFRQLDLPYSLSSPWPGRDLWISLALPTSQRVSQCWHSLPAASGAKKNPSLGWMYCFKIFQGEYSCKYWIFCTWYFSYKDFVSRSIESLQNSHDFAFEKPSNGPKWAQ